MFKRIGQISSFGVFDGFSGGQIPEFTNFNIIFGWNYSGKTTLSRLFRCLETGSAHPHHPNARFTIVGEDGTRFDHCFAKPCKVRVFNEDFRTENLRWDDTDGFRPVILLGAVNIERRDELAQKEIECSTINSYISDLERNQRELTAHLSEAEKECARQISQELSVSPFNRTHLTKLIASWKGVIPEGLDETAFQLEKRKAVSIEEKPLLPELGITIEDLGEVRETVSELLEEQVGSSVPIRELLARPDVGAWVEQGRHLHEDTTVCQFCNGPLKPDRVAELNAHYSASFDDIKRKVNDKISELTRMSLCLDGATYVRTAFYSDLEEEHAEAAAALRVSKKAFNDDIQALVETLKRKFENPFLILQLPLLQHDSKLLKEAVDRFGRLIAENNARPRAFAATRAAAVDRLKHHYASEAMRKVDLVGKSLELEDLKRQHKLEDAKRTSLLSEITILRTALSSAANGAEAINTALLQFFGKDDIKVQVVESGNFLLMRRNEVARNLSEGERTAIAFCYFIARLSEGGEDLSDTIVYIDDPISSLDGNHLQHINALIKKTFYYRQDSKVPKNRCLAKQLFISTHNFEFFHLTWEWMARSSGMSAAYLVERTDKSSLISSRIVECPDSIKLDGLKNWWKLAA